MNCDTNVVSTAVPLSEDLRERVDRATVKVIRQTPYGEGCGFLVPGGLILTAAHCVDYVTGGDMILGEPYLSVIESSAGVRFKAQVVMVDPGSDIAVLECPDGQQFYEEAEAFEQFCSSTLPIPIAAPESDINLIHLRSHLGDWTTGTASKHGFAKPQRLMRCQFIRPLRGGTSGSPILNSNGEAMMLASHGSDEGMQPLLSRCLSLHFLEAISMSQDVVLR